MSAPCFKCFGMNTWTNQSTNTHICYNSHKHLLTKQWNHIYYTDYG